MKAPVDKWGSKQLFPTLILYVVVNGAGIFTPDIVAPEHKLLFFFFATIVCGAALAIYATVKRFKPVPFREESADGLARALFGAPRSDANRDRSERIAGAAVVFAMYGRAARSHEFMALVRWNEQPPEVRAYGTTAEALIACIAGDLVTAADAAREAALVTMGRAIAVRTWTSLASDMTKVLAVGDNEAYERLLKREYKPALVTDTALIAWAFALEAVKRNDAITAASQIALCVEAMPHAIGLFARYDADAQAGGLSLSGVSGAPIVDPIAFNPDV